MEKKVLLIVNPVAGLGNIKKDINKIINNFENVGYKTEIEYTTLEKNGESIVQEKVNDGEIVVAVGGDGTLNEVVNGVLKNGKKVKMGFIPLGTTNDFAKTLNIPTDKYLFSREINNTIEKITMILPQVMYSIVGVVLIFFVVIVLVPMIQIYFGNFLFDMYL